MRKKVIFIGIFIFVILLALIIRTSYSYYVDRQDSTLISGQISVLRGDIDIATYVQDPNGEKEWGKDENNVDHYTRVDTIPNTVTSKYEFDYYCIKDDAETIIEFNYSTRLYTVTSNKRNKCLVFFHLSGFITSIYVEDDSGTKAYNDRTYTEFTDVNKEITDTQINYTFGNEWNITPKYYFEYNCTNGSTIYYKYCSKIVEQIKNSTNDICEVYFYSTNYLPSLSGDIVVYEKTYGGKDISEYTIGCGYCEKDDNAEIIVKGNSLYIKTTQNEDTCYMAGE